MCSSTNELMFRGCHAVKQYDPRVLAILEPVYGVVKFHPLLAKSTATQELSGSRWSQREAHDFSAECRHVMVRPYSEDSLNVLCTMSPSQSELLTPHSNIHQFGPRISTSPSSSNYQWNEFRWGESWSPSVSLGVETSSETRSSTPTTQKVNPHSSSTVVLNSAGSLHSTEGSEGRRKAKRGSFSQKFVDLVRGRKNGTTVLSKDSNHSSLLGKLEVTKEEMSDIEVIDAVADDKSHASIGSHVEEAVDIAKVHESPNSPSSRGAKDGWSLSLACGKGALPEVMKIEAEENTENYRSRTVSLVQGNFAPLVPDKSSSILAGNLNNQVLQGSGDNEDAEDSTSVNEGITDSHSNRFSVTSFFRNVNRQRFISECPPKGAQMTSVSDDYRRKRTERSTNSRSHSCPDLLEDDELQGSNQNILVVDQGNKTSTPMALSIPTIAGLIEKEFPYLTFLRTLPLPDIDEDAFDAELKREQERTRELYMKASLEHHKTLKRMFLADRLPAKIYDDMSNLIQGLPLEKQREILISRLALVNQHLMYERSSRLLHAERNRRLFGRIKQQKLSDVQIITLQKELHAAQLEREELVNALSGLRKEAKLALKERQESEVRYCEKLRLLNDEMDKYKNELDFLRRDIGKLVEENEKFQREASKLKRRYEDGEVLRKLTEAKIAGLQTLEAELHKAHETNQLLRDKLALSELKAKKQNSGISSVLPISGERDERVFSSQVEKLRKDLRNEQNANELLRVKKAEVEEECKASKEKCMDLEALLIRAAVVHKQQSDAAQHKYLSLLSVCEKQQTHILELCAYIEQQACRRTSPSTDTGNVPIPRGTVPEEILSFDSIQDPENFGLFAETLSPVDTLNTGDLFEFSPLRLDDLTEKESKYQTQQIEHSSGL